MNILDIFSNDNTKTFLGLRINQNGFLEILELQKINNSYNPIFWTTEDFLPFIKEDGFLDKKKFIDFFKTIRTKTKSQNLKIYFQNFEKQNEPLKITIRESLKIAGFGPQNKEVDKLNIKGVILSNNLTENENVLYFHQNNLTFFQTQKDKIKTKEEFSILDLNSKKALKIVNNLENKKIKLVGGFGELFRTTKNLLKACGAEVQEVNIWQNILSFSDAIPDISKEESQYIVEMLAFTTPKLRKWQYLPVKVEKEKVDFQIEKLESKPNKPKSKDARNQKEDKEKEKIFLPKQKEKKDFLPKTKKKSLLPKTEKIKSLPKEKIKKSTKLTKKTDKPKNTNPKTEKIKIEKKLPKQTKQIYLKKWIEKTQEEINQEIAKNIETYADKDLLFEHKSVDEKIAEFADFYIDENTLIEQNIEKYADKEILKKDFEKPKKSFWEKIKNFFSKK